MRGEIQIQKECILIQTESNEKEEIICALSEKLKNYGYVKNEYKEEVLKREEKFPTGLKIGKYNIAIPHTEPQYVNVPSIAIATLKRKVPFYRMDNCEEIVDVDIVLLLALNQSHTHVEILSKIISMCQDEKVIDELIQAKSEEKIVDIVKKRISGGD
ncbi:PTS sugar transporter subunit IIA [Amedibacillus sp. YH-ame6]